jgi:autotransporter translocation and assembly factor TamB
MAPAGQQIKIDGLSGDILGKLSIDQIEFSDANGKWLVVKEANLAWSPTALLSKHVSIQSLSAASADILRRPILVTDKNASPPSFNRYTLGALNIPRLSVAESAAPIAATLVVKGSGEYAQQNGQLRLNAQTVGNPVTDKADIDLSWSASELLRGNAEIISEPQGLISQLLKLGSAETLRLEIRTVGAAPRLQTDIVGVLGNEEFVTGRIESHSGYVTADANINPQSIPLLAPYDKALGGALDVSIASNANTSETDYTVKAIAPNLSLESRLLLDDEGISFSDLYLTADRPHLMLSESVVNLGQLKASGRGALGKNMFFSGNVALSDITYGDYAFNSLQGPVTVRRENTFIGFETDLSDKNAMRSDEGEFKPLYPNIRLNGRYNLDTAVLTASQANITLPGFSFEGSGMVGLSLSQAELEGVFDIESGFLDMNLPSDLRGTVKANRRGQATEIKLDGSATNFNPLPAPLAELIGEQVQFSLEGNLSASSQINLQRYQLSSENLSIDGSGRYDFDGQLSAKTRFETNSFTLNQLELSSVTGDADIAGRLDKLAFDVKAISPNANISGREILEAELEAAGTYTAQSLDAALQINGKTAQGPISVQTEADYEQGRWGLQDLSGDILGLKAQGTVSGRGGDTEAITANLTVSGDVSALLPAQSVDFQIKLDSSLADISGAIKGLNFGPLNDGSINLTAKGARDAVQMTANLKGETLIADITRPLILSSKGEFNLSGETLALTSEVEGELGRFPFRTTQPLTAKRGPNGVEITSILSLLDGSLGLEISGAEKELGIEADALSLPNILSLAGRPALEGRLDVTGRLTYSSAGLNGRADLALKDLKQPGGDMDAISLTAEAVITNDELNLTARTQTEELTGQSTLTGRLSSKPSLPYLSWPPETPLQGEVTANGNMGPLAEFFLPPETELTGNVALSMNYGIPQDVEKITAKLSMTDGRFESGTVGLKLNEMAFEANVNNATLTVENFMAKGTKGGTLSGGGQTALSFEDNGAITLKANKMRIFDRREGHATVSGTINLTQKDDKLTLQGELEADDAEINIDRLPRPGLPTLEVDFSESAEQIEEESTTRNSTALDLSLKSSGRIQLRGRGVNANLSLNTKVIGAFDAPQFTGRANIVRGRFDFLSKRFLFQDSEIVFADDILKSRLDITAIRETSDLTATVHIKGTAERPEMELTSDPQLPEDEVLSRILFGRSPTQLTTIETARLAAALTQLSGGSGFDLMGNLENALGLDTLDFAQTDTGRSQLTTGKYLSDNVYVEIRSAVEATPGLAVEWTPRKNISVEAETSPGETQRLSIQWNKDFD